MTIRKSQEDSEVLATRGGATRRQFAINALGGLGAVAWLGACAQDLGDESGAEAAPGMLGEGEAESEGAEATAESADAVGTCTAYPKQTGGPFYLNLNLVRSDITEGKPGVPLTIAVQVVRQSSGCAPIQGAAVDLWHADAKGWYSGYPGQGDNHNVNTTGQTFLRGTQLTDAEGKVRFTTIYPGYYRGRTTHAHFKVHLPGNLMVTTSQLYFPENITQAVYNTSAYSARGQKDTSNNADGIYRSNHPPLLAVTSSGTGYLGTMIVTVA